MHWATLFLVTKQRIKTANRTPGTFSGQNIVKTDFQKDNALQKMVFQLSVSTDRNQLRNEQCCPYPWTCLASCNRCSLCMAWKRQQLRTAEYFNKIKTKNILSLGIAELLLAFLMTIWFSREMSIVLLFFYNWPYHIITKWFWNFAFKSELKRKTTVTQFKSIVVRWYHETFSFRAKLRMFPFSK